jgi:hypothetical protein
MVAQKMKRRIKTAVSIFPSGNRRPNQGFTTSINMDAELI